MRKFVCGVQLVLLPLAGDQSCLLNSVLVIASALVIVGILIGCAFQGAVNSCKPMHYYLYVSVKKN